MQLPDNKGNTSYLNTTWHPLAEFSLCGEIDDDERELERASRLFIEAVRDFGLPPIRLSGIKDHLVDAVRVAAARNAEAGLNLPIIIRLFIHKKGGDGSERAVFSAGEISPHKRRKPGLKPNGIARGWGYFITARSVNPPSVSTEKSHYAIELFLYAEGG